MNKQSENKAAKTGTIDKSKKPSAAPTKDELSEQELDKASGGAVDAFIWFQPAVNDKPR
jgi:hypothetical protein